MASLFEKNSKLEQAFNQDREFSKLVDEYNQLNDKLNCEGLIGKGATCFIPTLMEFKEVYKKILDLATQYGLDTNEIRELKEKYEFVILMTNREVVGCG